jgi:hypothetical protein
MFDKGEIRHNLLGCLETALFMRSGTDRFHATKASMKKSFLIPMLVLPLSLILVLAAHPIADISLGTKQILMAIYSLRIVISLGAFLTLVYFMARSTDRLESFYRFVTAHNWLVIPVTVLMLPLVVSLLNGHYSWEEVRPLMVFITLYFYAYTAFMVTHVLRMPWELATCVAICGMAIHQTSLDVVKWAAVQTVYLVS